MHNIFKVLVKQTAFIYLTEILSRLANFASAILIVRYMGEAALGEISYAASLVFLFAVFTDLGYALISVKYFAQFGKEDKEVLNPGFTLKFISSVAIFLILLSYPVFVSINSALSLLISLLALDIVFSSFSFPYKYAFGGLRQFQYESILKIIIAAFSLALLLILVQVYPNIAVVGGGIPLFCSLFSFLYFWRLNKKLNIVNAKLTFDIAKLTAFFKSCLPFSIGAVVVMFHQKIGIILLKEFSDFESVGVFIIAYKIIEALNMIPNVILGITFPVLSSFFVNWNEKAEKIVFILTKYLLIISVPLALLVCFLGGDLLTLLINKPCGDCGGLLKILSWILVPSFLYSVTGGLINAGPRPGANTTIHFFMTGLYCVMLAVFLPGWGLLGLAYSMVLVEWLALLIRVIYIRKWIYKTGHIALLYKVFIAAGVSFIPLFMMNSYGAGIISLVLYLGILIISGFITKEEVLVFYRIAGSYGREVA